jgi:hypothetical protein
MDRSNLEKNFWKRLLKIIDNEQNIESILKLKSTEFFLISRIHFEFIERLIFEEI